MLLPRIVGAAMATVPVVMAMIMVVIVIIIVMMDMGAAAVPLPKGARAFPMSIFLHALLHTCTKSSTHCIYEVCIYREDG